MLTLKLFDGLVSKKRIKANNDLQTWARIEYKHDSEYAYNYMLEFGVAPTIGAKL